MTTIISAPDCLPISLPGESCPGQKKVLGGNGSCCELFLPTKAISSIFIGLQNDGVV